MGQGRPVGATRGVEAGRPGWRGRLGSLGGGDTPLWVCRCRPIHPDRAAARDCAQAEHDRRAAQKVAS